MKKAVRYLKAAEDQMELTDTGNIEFKMAKKGKLSLTGVGAVCARMLGAPSQLEDKALDLINSKTLRNTSRMLLTLGTIILRWLFKNKESIGKILISHIKKLWLQLKKKTVHGPHLMVTDKLDKMEKFTPLHSVR